MLNLFTLAVFITDNHQESCNVPHSKMQAIFLLVSTKTNGMQKGVDLLAGIFEKPSQPPPKGQTQPKLWPRRGKSINQKQKPPSWVAIVS